MLYRTGRGMALQSAARFIPSTISGLVSHIDSLDLSTASFSSGGGADGSIFSKLGDVSGNSNDFTREGSSVDNFTYKAAGTHGRPVIAKGPIVTFISDSASLYNSTGTLIYFMSFPFARTENSGAFGSLVSSSAFFDLMDGNTPRYRKAQNGSFPDAGSVDETDFVMFAVSFDSVSSATLWVNGNSTAFNPNDAYDNNGSLRIGSGLPTVADPEAEYYSVLAYDRGLDADEIAKIYKWGMKRYSKPSRRHMVLIAGQSNAEGRRSVVASGVPASYQNVHRISTLQTDQVLRDGADPVDANKGGFAGLMDNSGVGFGAGMPFADAALEGEALQMGLVPAAKGGSQIAEWARNDADPTDVTSFYGVLLTQALEAKKHGDLTALIWYQGESDAIVGVSQAAYETGTTAFINNIRSDLGMADLPIILSSLHQWHSDISATETDWNDIRTGQSNVASALSDVTYVDGSDLAGEVGDRTHLSVASYKTLGARWAVAYKAAVLT